MSDDLDTLAEMFGRKTQPTPAGQDDPLDFPNQLVIYMTTSHGDGYIRLQTTVGTYARNPGHILVQLVRSINRLTGLSVGVEERRTDDEEGNGPRD